ncbi:MAG: MurT ligase domain-containing protein [Hominimerdicola sp.]
MNIKNSLTILFGKLMVKILRLFGKDAGNFPGLVLWTINKDCLKAFKVECPIIAVTGTNGKTSVANYISHIFESTEKTIITNKTGNNLDTGICSLLLSLCDMKGRVKADYLVLETDESHVPVIYSKLKLETLVLLNFFRDQLDRNGEVETLILKVRNFLETFEGNLVLNADDPNVARLGKANPNNKNVFYFSVDRYAGATEQPYEVGEGKFCPFCGTELVYDYYQYSHVGKFHCPKCSFGKVQPYATVKNVNLGIPCFDIDNENYKIKHSNIYFVYNLAAVYATAKLYNFDKSIIHETFEKFEVNNGRLEHFFINGSRILVNLAKNPVGANMTIRIMNERPEEKELLFVLNDNLADGHDVSWIWDINFSQFKNVSRVITSGTRAYDIAIRIKCSGYDPDKIIVKPDLDDAMKALFATKCNKFAIANYTAVQPTRTTIMKYKDMVEKKAGEA